MTMYPGPGETSAASRRSAAAGTDPWQPPALFAPPREGGGSNGDGSGGGTKGGIKDPSKSQPVLAMLRGCWVELIIYSRSLGHLKRRRERKD
jgi:hypothetical protein